MPNQLTEEQQRKIEENRRKALERRAQRLGQTASNRMVTSAEVQPQKQSAATVGHPGGSIPVYAPQQSAQPLIKDAQTRMNQNHGLKHQQFSCNQIDQSTLCSSASRQVRLRNMLVAQFTFTILCIKFFSYV